MADTEHYVREDVRGFLAMLEQLGRPGVEELPVAEGRQGMAMMGQIAEAEAKQLPVVRNLTCPGPAGEIPLRLYDRRDSRPAGPVILFFHGGGFVIGDLDIYHSLCSEIAWQMDLPLVSVDYRLAPEAPFPAAPDDCEAAARWVAASPAQLERPCTGLIPMGDSAGGNLTIVTTNQLCARPAEVPVLFQVPIYPVADDVTQHRSFHDFAEGFLLTRKTMAWFTQQYAGDPQDERHTPMISDCANTPPTVLCTAGLDPLRDSGRSYAAHLIRQGTGVVYLEFAGTIHGFATLRKALPSAQGDLDALIAAMKLMAQRHAR